LSSGDKAAAAMRAPSSGVRDMCLRRGTLLRETIPTGSAWDYRFPMTTSEKTVFEGPLHQLARNTWQLLLLVGIVAVALGAIVLAWPDKTLFVAGVLFGIYLVVSGIGYVFAAFGSHAGAAMRVLSFLTGAVSLVLGFFCFRDQLESILLLALWIGIAWVFRGITLLAAALSFDHLPGRGWQALAGVIIIIGGGVMIIYPYDSIAILTLVAGCWLIAIGIVDVISAFQVRHRLKALTPS
jgi:uncharacterized membrane protein HdeD (DUF308 family)